MSLLTKPLQFLGKSYKFTGRNAAIWCLLGIVGTFVMAAVEMSIAYFIPLFLRSVGLGDVGIPASSMGEGLKLSAWTVSAALIALGLARFCGQYLMNQSSVAAQESVNTRLREVLIYRILLYPKQTYMPPTQSNYLLGTNFPAASFAVYLITMSFAQLLQALSLMVIMMYTAWKEASIGMIGLVFLGILVRRINRAIRAKAEQVPKENKLLISGIERVARNWLLVKVLETQRYEHRKFAASIDTVYSHSMKTASLSNLASSCTPFIGMLLITAIVFVSTSYWLTPGAVLISFLYIFIRFVQGLATTVSTMTSTSRYLPLLREATAFFFGFSDGEIERALVKPGSMSEEPQIHSLPLSSAVAAPSITFRNVDFAYEGKKVLDRINLHIPGGSTLGIIGPSGSGKSTMLLLMLGALEPSAGAVLLDDTAAQERFLKSSSKIGYVGPEPFLFSGSIRENLAYGLPEIEDAALWVALAEAQVADAIAAITGQLDHQITENGEGLSAGQKQRLCLARVFLRRPSLIVLDEATANLDAKTEAEVIDSLAQLKTRATTVIVTHRQAALKHADFVFDMEKGKVCAIQTSSAPDQLPIQVGLLPGAETFTKLGSPKPFLS